MNESSHGLLDRGMTENDSFLVWSFPPPMPDKQLDHVSNITLNGSITTSERADGGNFTDYDNDTEWDELSYDMKIDFTAFRYEILFVIVFITAYAAVFVLGFIGNFFVISVVLRTPSMHSATNFFIVNLALADMLVIVFCVPGTLLNNIYYGEVHFYPALPVLYMEYSACASPWKSNQDFAQSLVELSPTDR